MAAISSRVRRFVVWQFGRLGLVYALFPRSRQAAAWLVPMSLTAGICEEIVFRGLVPSWAEHISAMFSGPAWAPLVASAVTFSAAHLYQGWRGVVLTGVLGGYLYLLTVHAGSLRPAMAVHALIDLRISALSLVIGPLPAQVVAVPPQG